MTCVLPLLAFIVLFALPDTVGAAGLHFSTYLGGSNDEGAADIAVDHDGNAYVVGTTTSPDFPVTTGRELQGGQDAYVAKFSPEGALLFCTFVGGPCEDEGRAIAVDDEGNAYITGRAGFCFTDGLDPGVLVAKLDPQGELVYLYTFGGSLADSSYGYGIAVDSSGSAFVTGVADDSSGDFPTSPGAFQTSPCGGSFGDGFVAKLSAAGDDLAYCTYLCGTGFDAPVAIAVDPDGNAYVAGTTASYDFPTVNPYQSANPGGTVGEVGFVCKLDASGSKLIFSTYLGGQGGDASVKAIALDRLGNAYVTGETSGGAFPTTDGVVQPTSPLPVCFGHLCTDAFVAKFSSAGALLFSTYLAGESDEAGEGIAVDDDGNVYVAGSTTSLYFPIRNAVQQDNRGLNDLFVTKLNPDASRILFSTLLGAVQQPNSGLANDGDDNLSGMALGPTGDVYLTGYTTSLNFPTTAGVFQPKPKGGLCFLSLLTCGDAFVARLNVNGPSATPPIHVEVTPTEAPLGGWVTATWAGLTNASSNDRLALYRLGQTGAGAFLDASYPTTGEAAGSINLQLSKKLTPGTYEFRLMSTDPQYSALLTVVARSEPVVILAKPAPTPRLVCARNPNGSFSLRVDGAVAQKYNIEATETLNPPNWHVIGPLAEDASGTPEFNDQISPASHGRFYRLAKP
jgi:hypothetical protein